jgi:hypothetical protein
MKESAVRVSDHALISTGAAAALYPRLRGKVLVPWAASVLIDVDHYLWFCVSQRSLSPRQAVRFFNQAQPPQHSGTRLLHHPVTLLLVLLVSYRWRWAALLLLGMAFHVGLDVYHGARMDEVRRAALRRDAATCQQCGARGPDVVAHVWRQPRLLAAYRVEHLISLCAACHELAHTQGDQRIRASAASRFAHAAD